MKQVVLKYGAIAFLIIMAMWMITIAMYDGAMNMTFGMVVGFATMALAFSMVYIAIRKWTMGESVVTKFVGRPFTAHSRRPDNSYGVTLRDPPTVRLLNS